MGSYLDTAERDFAAGEKAGSKTLIPPEPANLTRFSPHHVGHLDGKSVVSLQRLAGNRAVTSLLRPTVQRGGCGCGGGCGGSCGGGGGGGGAAAQEEKEPESAVSRLAIQRAAEEEGEM